MCECAPMGYGVADYKGFFVDLVLDVACMSCRCGSHQLEPCGMDLVLLAQYEQNIDYRVGDKAEW